MRLALLLLAMLVASGRSHAAGFDLPYGPHPVGFRSLVRSDPSRTFIDHGRVAERPIRIDLWYPAKKGSGTSIRLRDYADFDEGTGALPPALLDTVTRARRDAAFANASFPLLVYAHTETHQKAVIAEYLASHGFVFAAPAVRGTFDEEIDPGMADVETQARDLEFTIGIVAPLSVTDRSRVAVAGMSFGALSALLAAMRNANVDAVLSLDGGIGSAPNVEGFGFARSPFHDASRVRVPILHLYGPKVPGTQLDYLRSLVYSERYLAPFEALEHADFSGGAMFTMNAAKQEAFILMLRTTRTFLDRLFRDGSDAMPPGVERLAALPAPASIEEARQLVRSQGAGALRRPSPFPLDVLRRTASWLSDKGKTGEAREVMTIAAETYPQSARAHYGLAVILMTLGENSKALEHLTRAQDLAPTDPALDDAARRRIVDATRDRIESLRRH